MLSRWFDGGTQDKVLGAKIPPLIKELQPNAVCFQGPTKTNGVRWAGSESGHAELPNWSAAASATDYQSGAVDGQVFAPTEADVTLSSDGSWYWRPGQPIKSLAYLTSLHDASVGVSLSARSLNMFLENMFRSLNMFRHVPCWPSGQAHTMLLFVDSTTRTCSWTSRPATAAACRPSRALVTSSLGTG